MHLILPTIPSVCFRTTLRKLVIWQKLKRLMSYRWIFFTIVARSVRLLSSHMCEDVHTTRQLHYQWWSGQCHAKHAMTAPEVSSCRGTSLQPLTLTQRLRHSMQTWHGFFFQTRVSGFRVCHQFNMLLYRIRWHCELLSNNLRKIYKASNNIKPDVNFGFRR